MCLRKTCVDRASVIGVFFTSVALLMRLTSMLCTPLWLDAFVPSHEVPSNSSLRNNSVMRNVTVSVSAIQQTNPYFQMLMQSLAPTAVFSIVYAGILIVCPARITDTERSYPKYMIMVPAAGQTICGVLVNYSMSGTRTPPYLIAVLNNFVIPIQFIVR